jgi:hypothetical protein
MWLVVLRGTLDGALIATIASLAVGPLFILSGALGTGLHCCTAQQLTRQAVIADIEGLLVIFWTLTSLAWLAAILPACLAAAINAALLYAWYARARPAAVFGVLIGGVSGAFWGFVSVGIALAPLASQDLGTTLTTMLTDPQVWGFYGPFWGLGALAGAWHAWRTMRFIRRGEPVSAGQQ